MSHWYLQGIDESEIISSLKNVVIIVIIISL